MAQFIDIACGDYAPIDAGAEHKRQIAESLIEQYNNIADPVAAKSLILEKEKVARNDARIKLYRIMLNLINVYSAYDEVRDILLLTRQDNIAAREDERLKAKIEQMLRTEESLHERMANEMKNASPSQVSENEFRASFDRQTARLIAHFKFAVNHESISASVYANLVNMACRQQRQQKG